MLRANMFSNLRVPEIPACQVGALADLYTVVAGCAEGCLSSLKAPKCMPRLFDSQSLHDVEFDASQPRFTPFRLIANWIVLSVKINGRDCRMLLDSGAPNVISVSAPAALVWTSKEGFRAGALERGKSPEEKPRSRDCGSEMSCCIGRRSM